MHLHFWTDPHEPASGQTAQNKCCTLQGLEDARAVASQLKIPFFVMNVEKQFKANVVDGFLDSYAAGRTPNPCIECNRTIKFGELLSRAMALGAHALATGHYAKVEVNKKTGERELFMARDKSKDQSYFLYHLSQEKLAKVMFPLGDMLKSEVYESAQKFGLVRVCEKPESQGLCFFSESKPKYFLKRYLEKKYFQPGPIITVDGRIVGTHSGLPMYTIGQRSGLGIGGIKAEPEGASWYVVRIEPEKNALIIGREKDILSYSFQCADINFISCASGDCAGENLGEKMKIKVRIRHRGELLPAVLEIEGSRGIVMLFDLPARGVAAGQAAVFYEGEKIIGGGTIEGKIQVKDSNIYETQTVTARRGVPVAY